MPNDSPGVESRHVLSLDGGGAKGFYSIGVLLELEAMLGRPLSQHFDLIYGTSTGAIIATLLAAGRSCTEVHDLYRAHVVAIMAKTDRTAKTAALEELARDVFKDVRVEDFQSDLGVVATRWATERPMIFKTSCDQAHGLKATFQPFFGCAVSDAVIASCSAYPFFERKIVRTADNEDAELVDGGFCANNPTLFAIADAVQSLGWAKSSIRVLSVGVGAYPEPKYMPLTKKWIVQHWPGVRLLQKVLEINTATMERLRAVLFDDVSTIRINDAFTSPEMATDLFEHDLGKLSVLLRRGRDSFGQRERELRLHFGVS